MLTRFNAALIIPTGIGASIGGFGGDAMTLLPMLSEICDTVITHPNVANAAFFQTLPPNVLYVEGYALDQWFLGQHDLLPVRHNKIGVIWDSGCPPVMRTLHQNVVQAVQTTYGVSIVSIKETAEPVSLDIVTEASGRSTGRINNGEVLLEAGRQLLSQGATALAVCCLMPSEDPSAYQAGQSVDPIGGLEAMISHLLVQALQVPCAHAPVFPLEEALPVTDRLVDPRAASEFVVSSFLPCVLTGLTRAPRYVSSERASQPSLSIADLDAVILPADALGGVPALVAVEQGIPILAIENNQTVMAATAKALGISAQVISCANYLEAIGHLLALKQGITLPPHVYASASNRLRAAAI